MKRTVAFPSMPGRDASKFDPSQQLNLGLLHEPKRQGRSLVYDNVDPAYLKRRTACAADLSKSTGERFMDPPELRAEVREERLAMRDTHRLEALMDRQQRRYEASMNTVLVPSVSSKRSVIDPPSYSFPKATRRLGGPSPSKGGGGGGGGVSQSYSYLPRVTGAVDFSKGSTRDGKSPPPQPASQLRAATSLEMRPFEGPPLRSTSVPVDVERKDKTTSLPMAPPAAAGATLGDFIAPSIAAPAADGERNSPQGQPLNTHRTTLSRSPDGRSNDGGEGDAPPAFFLSKREQYALRDLSAPDMKRGAGRTKTVVGTSERRQYRYEDSQCDTFNELQVSQSHRATQRTVGGALPFAKAGREPTQPPEISKHDPLVKAARRVQDDITETLSPQYRIHLGKMRAVKQREKMKRRAEQQDGAGHDTTALSPIVSGDGAPSASPKPTFRKPRKEPLYTVGHGGGRLSMNLDVLFKGKRFKELLAMHDFMIDRELNGTSTTTHSPAHHSAGGASTTFGDTATATVSWDDDGPSRRSNSPAALTIAERMEQGLPVSFEEALAEAERRERLLQLRSLSLMKDNPAVVDPQPRTDKRGTISFVSAPDRFASGEKPELHDKVFEGLAQLKVEQHSPATAMMRSHLKLKQMYDMLHDEVGREEGSPAGRSMSPKDAKNASMRRLSTLH